MKLLLVSSSLVCDSHMEYPPRRRTDGQRYMFCSEVNTLRQQLEKVDEHNSALAAKAEEAGAALQRAQGAEKKALSRADALKGMLEAMRKQSRLHQQTISHKDIAARLPSMPRTAKPLGRGKQPPALELCLQLQREVPLSSKVVNMFERLMKHVATLLEERDALTEREVTLVGMLARDGDVRR